MEYHFTDLLRRIGSIIWTDFQVLCKWLALAGVTGVLSGGIGALFHHGVDEATALRGEYPWLLWCLPLAGLAIVAIYKLTRTEGQGTNDIFDAVREGRPLSICLPFSSAPS